MGRAGGRREFEKLASHGEPSSDDEALASKAQGE